MLAESAHLWIHENNIKSRFRPKTHGAEMRCMMLEKVTDTFLIEKAKIKKLSWDHVNHKLSIAQSQKISVISEGSVVNS